MDCRKICLYIDLYLMFLRALTYFFESISCIKSEIILKFDDYFFIYEWLNTNIMLSSNNNEMEIIYSNLRRYFLLKS